MKHEALAGEVWRYLIRKELLCKEVGLDKPEILTVTKEVAVCILAHPGIILEDIIRNPYFKDTSRSTLKRAVAYLYTNGYIKYTRGQDKRTNKLYFKNGD